MESYEYDPNRVAEEVLNDFMIILKDYNTKGIGEAKAKGLTDGFVKFQSELAEYLASLSSNSPAQNEQMESNYIEKIHSLEEQYLKFTGKESEIEAKLENALNNRDIVNEEDINLDMDEELDYYK